MVEVETVLLKCFITYETHYLKLLLSVLRSCTSLNHIDDSLAGNQSNLKKQGNKPITFEKVITARKVSEFLVFLVRMRENTNQKISKFSTQYIISWKTSHKNYW